MQDDSISNVSTEGFKPSSFQQPVEDLAKEYEDWDNERTREYAPATTEEIYKENSKYVNQGKLNPRTGEFSLSKKAQRLVRWNPGSSFKTGYDRIRWDS